MRKTFFISAILAITSLLTSCTTDENGDVHIDDFVWIMLGVIIVASIIGIALSPDNSKQEKAKFKDKGLTPRDFIKTGDIVAGHPSLQNGVKNSLILKKDDVLKIYSVKDYQSFDFQLCFPISEMASIPIADIIDISIVDKSEIERKITVGRIFLVGIFALGWKKKKVHEQAFLIIKWRYKEKFENETLFVFEDKNAMANANKARNSLLKLF